MCYILQSSIYYSVFDLLPVHQFTPALYDNPASNIKAISQSAIFIYYTLTTFADVSSQMTGPASDPALNPALMVQSHTQWFICNKIIYYCYYYYLQFLVIF